MGYDTFLKGWVSPKFSKWAGEVLDGTSMDFGDPQEAAKLYTMWQQGYSPEYAAEQLNGGSDGGDDFDWGGDTDAQALHQLLVENADGLGDEDEAIVSSPEYKQWFAGHSKFQQKAHAKDPQQSLGYFKSDTGGPESAIDYSENVDKDAPWALSSGMAHSKSFNDWVQSHGLGESASALYVSDKNAYDAATKEYAQEYAKGAPGSVKAPTAADVIKGLVDYPNSPWQWNPDDHQHSSGALLDLDKETPDGLKKKLQGWATENFGNASKAAQHVLHTLFGEGESPLPSTPGSAPAYDPQAFLSDFKQAWPGSIHGVDSFTDPASAKAKLQTIVNSGSGSASSQKAQQLLDKWFGGDSQAAPSGPIDLDSIKKQIAAADPEYWNNDTYNSGNLANWDEDDLKKELKSLIQAGEGWNSGSFQPGEVDTYKKLLHQLETATPAPAEVDLDALKKQIIAADPQYWGQGEMLDQYTKPESLKEKLQALIQGSEHSPANFKPGEVDTYKSIVDYLNGGPPPEQGMAAASATITPSFHTPPSLTGSDHNSLKPAVQQWLWDNKDPAMSDADFLKTAQGWTPEHWKIIEGLWNEALAANGGKPPAPQSGPVPFTGGVDFAKEYIEAYEQDASNADPESWSSNGIAIKDMTAGQAKKELESDLQYGFGDPDKIQALYDKYFDDPVPDEKSGPQDNPGFHWFTQEAGLDPEIAENMASQQPQEFWANVDFAKKNPVLFHPDTNWGKVVQALGGAPAPDMDTAELAGMVGQYCGGTESFASWASLTPEKFAEKLQALIQDKKAKGLNYTAQGLQTLYDAHFGAAQESPAKATIIPAPSMAPQEFKTPNGNLSQDALDYLKEVWDYDEPTMAKACGVNPGGVMWTSGDWGTALAKGPSGTFPGGFAEWKKQQAAPTSGKSALDDKPKTEAEWNKFFSLMEQHTSGPLSNTIKNGWKQLADSDWEESVTGTGPGSKAFAEWKALKDKGSTGDYQPPAGLAQLSDQMSEKNGGEYQTGTRALDFQLWAHGLTDAQVQKYLNNPDMANHDLQNYLNNDAANDFESFDAFTQTKGLYASELSGDPQQFAKYFHEWNGDPSPHASVVTSPEFKEWFKHDNAADLDDPVNKDLNTMLADDTNDWTKSKVKQYQKYLDYKNDPGFQEFLKGKGIWPATFGIDSGSWSAMKWAYEKHKKEQAAAAEHTPAHPEFPEWLDAEAPGYPDFIHSEGSGADNISPQQSYVNWLGKQSTESLQYWAQHPQQAEDSWSYYHNQSGLLSPADFEGADADDPGTQYGYMLTHEPGFADYVAGQSDTQKEAWGEHPQWAIDAWQNYKDDNPSKFGPLADAKKQVYDADPAFWGKPGVKNVLDNYDDEDLKSKLLQYIHDFEHNPSSSSYKPGEIDTYKKVLNQLGHSEQGGGDGFDDLVGNSTGIETTSPDYLAWKKLQDPAHLEYFDQHPDEIESDFDHYLENSDYKPKSLGAGASSEALPTTPEGWKQLADTLWPTLKDEVKDVWVNNFQSHPEALDLDYVQKHYPEQWQQWLESNGAPSLDEALSDLDPDSNGTYQNWKSQLSPEMQTWFAANPKAAMTDYYKYVDNFDPADDVRQDEPMEEYFSPSVGDYEPDPAPKPPVDLLNAVPGELEGVSLKEVIPFLDKNKAKGEQGLEENDQLVTKWTDANPEWVQLYCKPAMIDEIKKALTPEGFHTLINHLPPDVLGQVSGGHGGQSWIDSHKPSSPDTKIGAPPGAPAAMVGPDGNYTPEAQKFLENQWSAPGQPFTAYHADWDPEDWKAVAEDFGAPAPLTGVDKTKNDLVDALIKLDPETFGDDDFKAALIEQPLPSIKKQLEYLVNDSSDPDLQKAYKALYDQYFGEDAPPGESGALLDAVGQAYGPDTQKAWTGSTPQQIAQYLANIIHGGGENATKAKALQEQFGLPADPWNNPVGEGAGQESAAEADDTPQSWAEAVDENFGDLSTFASLLKGKNPEEAQAYIKKMMKADYKEGNGDAVAKLADLYQKFFGGNTGIGMLTGFTKKHAPGEPLTPVELKKIHYLTSKGAGTPEDMKAIEADDDHSFHDPGDWIKGKFGQQPGGGDVSSFDPAAFAADLGKAWGATPEIANGSGQKYKDMSYDEAKAALAGSLAYANSKGHSEMAGELQPVYDKWFGSEPEQPAAKSPSILDNKDYLYSQLKKADPDWWSDVESKYGDLSEEGWKEKLSSVIETAEEELENYEQALEEWESNKEYWEDNEKSYEYDEDGDLVYDDDGLPILADGIDDYEDIESKPQTSYGPEELSTYLDLYHKFFGMTDKEKIEQILQEIDEDAGMAHAFNDSEDYGHELDVLKHDLAIHAAADQDLQDIYDKWFGEGSTAGGPEPSEATPVIDTPPPGGPAPTTSDGPAEKSPADYKPKTEAEWNKLFSLIEENMGMTMTPSAKDAWKKASDTDWAMNLGAGSTHGSAMTKWKQLHDAGELGSAPSVPGLSFGAPAPEPQGFEHEKSLGIWGTADRFTDAFKNWARDKGFGTPKEVREIARDPARAGAWKDIVSQWRNSGKAAVPAPPPPPSVAADAAHRELVTNVTKELPDSYSSATKLKIKQTIESNDFKKWWMGLSPEYRETMKHYPATAFSDFEERDPSPAVPAGGTQNWKQIPTWMQQNPPWWNRGKKNRPKGYQTMTDYYPPDQYNPLATSTARPSTPIRDEPLEQEPLPFPGGVPHNVKPTRLYHGEPLKLEPTLVIGPNGRVMKDEHGNDMKAIHPLAQAIHDIIQQHHKGKAGRPDTAPAHLFSDDPRQHTPHWKPNPFEEKFRGRKWKNLGSDDKEALMGWAIKKQIPPDQMYSYLQSLGATPEQALNYGFAPVTDPTITPQDYGYPSLGHMILDWFGNPGRKKGAVSGVGVHHTTNESTADQYSGGKDSYMNTKIAFDWDHRGEDAGRTGTDSDTNGSTADWHGEYEVTLAPGAQVKVKSVKIRVDGEWKEVLSHPIWMSAAELQGETDDVGGYKHRPVDEPVTIHARRVLADVARVLG